MKIVILAAGLGSRLREGASEVPKPLTRLDNGQSIMERQVSSISKFFDFNDIMVVVGYKSGIIMEEFPNLTFIYNQDFSSNNTSKSLLRALKKVKNESVLWFNGDVVFDESLLENLLSSIEKGNSFVSVNNSKVSDEEIKYTLNESGHINELSKVVKNGLGEAVGINFVGNEHLESFKDALSKCDDNDYFERGLEYIIDNGASVAAVDISKHFCMEIDFQEDLKAANESLTKSDNL